MKNLFKDISAQFDEVLEPLEKIQEDSRIQLMSSIQEAKEDENSFELILTLNIFFEALITSWLKEHHNLEVGEDYFGSLKNARDGGLLNKTQYGLLDDLRDSRNDYAHDVEAHHPDYQSTIEENDRLEEVYELWANLSVNIASNIEVDNTKIS